MTDRSTRKAAVIIAAIFVFEGFFAFPNLIRHPGNFLRYLGFLPGPHVPSIVGCALAVLVVALFVGFSLRLPSVRANLVRLSWLKLLAAGMAIASGILEEWVFRGLLMDWAAAHGCGNLLQVIISALAFGLMHGVWGLFGGSMRAAVGATVATGALGGALAAVYLASGRSLAPCVGAHALINLLIEPGLVLAAVRGEMGAANGGRGSAKSI